MTEFIYFIGRFHVLVLHLPIGMLLLTVALDFMSRSPRYQNLSQALPICWAATALSAVLTVALGMMHFSEGGFTGPSASAHRNYGISVAFVSLLVWLLVAKLPALYGQVRIASSLLLLFLVTMTGHYGGNLTHGSTYLVEYAPQSIRAMAGLGPRRPAVTDITLADPWYDIVKPMLDTRCSSCHNNDKQSGELNLASLDGLRAGGKSGLSVISGDANSSELYSRISLPGSHEDFMPAEGKTPLTESQREIVSWWINAGMPVNTTVGNIAPDNDVLTQLAAVLGLADSSATLVQVTYPAVPAEVLAQLANQGFLVRQLSRESNGFIVSINSRGKTVTGEMLESLASVSQSIVDLNLASTGLYDELLELLADYPVLQKLNLSNNSISDNGLDRLTGNSSLSVLNLYGNPQISDAGLNRLSGLTNLSTLYVWGTGATDEGIASLSVALPGLTIHGQSEIIRVDSNAE